MAARRGRLLHARGELAEAEQALERALATRRELLGDAHLHVAATRQALAAVTEESATESAAERSGSPAAEESRRSAAGELDRSTPHGR